MTSRGQCPRGRVLVNVFTPPSGNPVSAPGYHNVSRLYTVSSTRSVRDCAVDNVQ